MRIGEDVNRRGEERRIFIIVGCFSFFFCISFFLI